MLRLLWGRSQPARGTIVERYLASREIRLAAMPATLWFLPPQKAGQHPAMISACLCPDFGARRAFELAARTTASQLGGCRVVSSCAEIGRAPCVTE